MSQATVQRILEAATLLFAERGFEETSVRDITSQAGVNLAAINYHFGSRQALIHAVAERYLTPLCSDLEYRLDDRLSDSDSPSMEELLEMLVKSMLTAVEPDPHGVNLFMRLLGYAYSETPGLLREYLLRRYGQTFDRFLALMRSEAHSLQENEFFWRCHFMLSACFLPLSSHETLRTIEQERFARQTPVEITLHRLIPFLAAGLRAEQDRVSYKKDQLW